MAAVAAATVVTAAVVVAVIRISRLSIKQSRSLGQHRLAQAFLLYRKLYLNFSSKVCEKSLVALSMNYNNQRENLRFTRWGL